MNDNVTLKGARWWKEVGWKHILAVVLMSNKAQHAQRQREKKHESAELARLGFPCQLSNDKQHVKNERAHAKGEAEPGNLLFTETEHGWAGKE